MRKRVQVALAVLIVVLAGGSAWLGLRQREPVYHGKPLSVWLEIHRKQMMNTHPYDGPAEEAIWDRQVVDVEQAIRHIGTNALPVLIARLRAHDTPLKQLLMIWAQKQKFVPFHFKSADQRRQEALGGYMAVGSLARAQVSNLMDCLTNDPSPNVRMAAARALIAIGPDARVAGPALFRAAKDMDESVRNNALWALSRILPDPQLAVPVLIAGLDDTNSVARENAAIALMKYGPEAEAAVPALLRTLTTNRHAGWALKAIDPEAAAKAGVK